MKKLCLPALLAALLAGCGGGSDSSPAPVAVDAFTAVIAQQFMDMSDTADVAAIDMIAVTGPETTEPTPI